MNKTALVVVALVSLSLFMGCAAAPPPKKLSVDKAITPPSPTTQTTGARQAFNTLDERLSAFLQKTENAPHTWKINDESLYAESKTLVEMI